ncbi:unnamed protein product [Agarophyton chilense]|eukprot:gb/GEZJ01006902.1/.p1 GENE.gb/GEZJ01006902.1/~~gb/GEZJ01006902.1/.p1  ORF type:complete len:300 (-),score=22.05 gb/GEZJ01006902.1/:403-1302(-)
MGILHTHRFNQRNAEQARHKATAQQLLAFMKTEVFQIPIASEIINVLNFVFVDLFLVSFVLQATSNLAGYVNNRVLRHSSRLKLVPFDIPLIGGGLITFRGKQRNILILLRISILLAVSTSTFGIEGRTQVPTLTKSAHVRVPGFSRSMDESTMNRIQKGFSCGTWEQNVFVFGTVADGLCYKNVTLYSSIRNVSQVGSIQAEAHNCNQSYSEKHGKPITTYRCDKADVVCQGVPPESGLEFSEGLENNLDGDQTCKAILFADDGNHVIGCSKGLLRPESNQTLGHCWKFAMKREDAWW